MGSAKTDGRNFRIVSGRVFVKASSDKKILTFYSENKNFRFVDHNGDG